MEKENEYEEEETDKPRQKKKSNKSRKKENGEKTRYDKEWTTKPNNPLIQIENE